MSVKEVSLEQFKRLAGELRCEPEALMAVSHVEAPRGGFYEDGFPTILFERHKFYKHARRDKRGEWSRQYPTICNPAPTPRGGYGTVAAQRIKFSQAFVLDPDAAMMACSWGAFQELGENYDDYGFENVGQFVDMMKSGIEGQLEIFVRSIRRRGLVDELQRKDWKGFARNYNGAGYRRFEYDTQMENAYRVFKNKRINWAAISAVPQFEESDILQLTDSIGPVSTEQEPAGSTNGLPEQPATYTVEEPEPEAVAGPGAVTGDGEVVETISETFETDGGTKTVEASVTTPAGDAPDAEPKGWLVLEDWKPFAARWLKRLWAGVSTVTLPGGFGLGMMALKDPPNWFIYVAIGVVVLIVIVVLALIVSAVLLAIWYFNRKEIAAGKMEAAKSLVDPNSKNLGVRIERK